MNKSDKLVVTINKVSPYRTLYEVKLTLKSSNGTSVRRSVYGTTKTDAPRKAQTQAEHFRTHTSLAAALAAMTRSFGDLADEYATRTGLAPKTVATYQYSLRATGLIGPLLDVPIQDLGEHRLLEWYDSVRHSRASVSEQRRAVAMVGYIVRYGRDFHRLFPDVRLALLTPVQANPQPVSYWTPDTAKTFLHAMQHRPEAPAMEVMLVLGLRVGEARALRWRDVSLSARTLKVERQITDINGQPTEGPTKSKSSRRLLHLPPSLCDRLDGHRSRQRAQGYGRPEDFIAPTRNGTPYTLSRLARSLRQVIHAEDLKHITVHGLRHTYAAVMLLQRTDISELSRLLGHSDTRTTEKYYGHIYDSSLKAAAQKSGFLLDDL